MRFIFGLFLLVMKTFLFVLLSFRFLTRNIYFSLIDKFISVCSMSRIKINIAFRNIRIHADSEKRAVHIFERMRLRGITIQNIRDAIQKGPKMIKPDQTIIASYRWYAVVYREFYLGRIRKIYPITVLT